VGSVLTPAGLDKSVGLISTQYIKDPLDEQWANDPAVMAWKEFMGKYYPEGNLKDGSNIYGYTVAATLHEVLKQAGNNLTRENVMKQAAAMKGFRVETMLPGISINTGADDFAPIQSVQLIKFDGKQWVRFGNVMGK
jgi:branched-chain amino acid transport system substrate-binding protein